jgi:Ala-tRNA(Pro) deacylase
MAIPGNIREYLDTNHVTWWRRIHRPAFTAQETAQVDHVPGREFAKTVVLKADQRLVLAVLPADQVIRFDILAADLACKRLVLASESEFSTKFPGCERGAMPPFGKLFGLQVYCDLSLARQDEIEFNGGTHTEIIRMAFSEFDLLETPVILNFAEKPRRIRMTRVA